MTTVELERWWNRPTFSRTLTRCDECETLQEDVRKRVNYWPNITAICCENCFKEMIGELVH